MSEERNIRQCKRCKVLKERILQGKFNDKDKKWSDPEGGIWNGHTCPTCTRIRVKESMRKLRNKNV